MRARTTLSYVQPVTLIESRYTQKIICQMRTKYFAVLTAIGNLIMINLRAL